MPTPCTPCIGCSAPLPENAAFCPRCGRATGASVIVKESTESLLRHLASMLQKHSARKLVVKFISTTWGVESRRPTKKVKSIRFHTGMGLLESSRAFVVTPRKGKTLFADSSWADIAVEVFQEAGFDDAKAFGEAYRTHTRRNVEIVKKYT
jgi:hypothetical protein